MTKKKDAKEKLLTMVEQVKRLVKKEKKRGKICGECGRRKETTRPRIDNGLTAGDHCDECWQKMVTECRQRSW